MKMIVLDYQPFSMVEDKGFRDFVKALNPSYTLPNRKLISTTLILSLYLECKTKLAELIQKGKKFCLTTDCWTSSNMDSYLAVTAHFFVDFELKSVLLQCEHFTGSRTSAALAATLRKIAIEWQIQNKITLAVSDNAYNLQHNECLDSIRLESFRMFPT